MKTAAQRYNDRLDEIFDTAKKLNQEQDDRRKFMGRNIGQKDDLFYVTWAENDLTSSHDKRYGKDYFSSHKQARAYMTGLKNNGTYWFDAHFDPTA